MIKYNISLPSKVIIGKGFKIEHIGGIVVNPEVVLGENVNIYNGVTIGVTKRGDKKGVPTIGNKVWIGPNSVIVGKITIGDDVLLAPGSYVNFDVPSNSIVIGNPGQIKKSENSTLYYIDNIV